MFSETNTGFQQHIVLYNDPNYNFARGSSCEVLWWVCLSVCLSACRSVCRTVRQDISGITRAIFTKFLCMLPMSVTRSSSGTLAIGRIAYRREGVFFHIDNAL